MACAATFQAVAAKRRLGIWKFERLEIWNMDIWTSVAAQAVQPREA